MAPRFRTFLILILIITTSASASVRGMWVVRYTLNNRPQVEKLLLLTTQLKLTDLYVQIWAKGQSYLAAGSQADSERTIADENFSRIVTYAHQHGIKVHAWINVFHLWSGEQNPKSDRHLFYQAKKYILQSPDDGDTLPDYTYLKKKGLEGYFLDPLNPENKKRIKKMIVKLFNHHHVDGIHLDYFRYPDKRYIFSQSGRTVFMLNNYYDPLPFYKAHAPFPLPEIRFVKETFSHYLQRNLNDFLEDISQFVHAKYAGASLTVAVKPDLIVARNRYFQDWSYWLKHNLVDAVLLMNYIPDIDVFKRNMALAHSVGKDQKIIIGVSTYNQPEAQVVQKVKRIHHSTFAGYALFSFNDISDTGKRWVLQYQLNKFQQN